MRVQIVKRTLPVLLALALGCAPAVFASGHEAAPAGHAAIKTVIHKAEAVAAEQHETVTTEMHEAHAGTAEHTVAAGQEGHGTAVEGEGHGGAHHTPMITAARLKDLFWRTMNFMALVIILVKFLAKPIAGGLAGRRKTIQEEIEALEVKREEAERSYKEFEVRLGGMEKEMDTVVEKAVAMAEDEKVRILKEAEESAEDIKRQAEAAVQAAVVEAKRSLQVEVADKAAAMAEELIVKNLTAKDQVAITEQYLEKVGAVQ
ncbi:MAG: ATP synthase F0 subunit B [Desulfobulbus sp.]|nr:MAG: ATP synthase F0 subunit B [Desulfobulbus sp.]RUM38201.1 MAG: ATP synthase F0 subunit B [Desulfobulbus sp.]